MLELSVINLRIVEVKERLNRTNIFPSPKAMFVFEPLAASDAPGMTMLTKF